VLVRVGGADVFDDLATYEYGAAENTADKAMALLNDTPVDRHGAIEAKLIGVISSKDSTQTGKAFACRMLQQIGSEKCVPALGALLTDEVLSGYARLALERMKGCASAAKALREALDKAPDKAKIGILGSIGEGCDAQAVAQVGKLAGSDNPAVASAALMALGKMGSREAASALAGAKVGAALKQAHLDALIACAGRLGGSAAAPLYQKVLAGKSGAHQVAAMRGLAAADPKAGAAMIAEALGSDDPKLRAGALGAVVTAKGEQLTKAVTALLASAPADRKSVLITALGSRGDKAALGAVSEYLNSKEAAVRDAAIAAACALGDASTVDVLLKLAVSAEAKERVVRALTRMKDAGADAALVKSLSKPDARAVAIQVLAARNCTTAAPELLKLVKDPSADVRKEAWSGLGALGNERDMAAVMASVVKVGDDRELRYALDAVKRIYGGASDKNGCFAAISGSYGSAPAAIKAVLLELGAVAGSDAALELERKAVKSGDKELRKAAIRALASWPNAAAADDLYALATSAQDDVERILGLRGYIGIAGSDRIAMSGGDRMKIFGKAGGLVRRADEKRLIISGLSRVRSAAGLGMLLKYMDDAEVKREAEMAAANLLWETRNQKSADGESVARKLMDSEDKAVRDRAGSVVSEWGKFKSYVTSWLAAGPYDDKGKGGADVAKKVFPPESNDAGVKWSRIEKGIDRETINLEAQFGSRDRCCVYVKTVVDCPREQPARLELGSDDGIKAWLNGKLVHDLWMSRGCAPGQDKVKVTLKQGRNELMLKITDESGHWAFSCRLRGEKGVPIEGLKTSAE